MLLTNHMEQRIREEISQTDIQSTSRFYD